MAADLNTKVQGESIHVVPTWGPLHMCFTNGSTGIYKNVIRLIGSH